MNVIIDQPGHQGHPEDEAERTVDSLGLPRDIATHEAVVGTGAAARAEPVGKEGEGEASPRE